MPDELLRNDDLDPSELELELQRASTERGIRQELSSRKWTGEPDDEEAPEARLIRSELAVNFVRREIAQFVARVHLGALSRVLVGGDWRYVRLVERDGLKFGRARTFDVMLASAAAAQFNAHKVSVPCFMGDGNIGWRQVGMFKLVQEYAALEAFNGFTFKPYAHGEAEPPPPPYKSERVLDAVAQGRYRNRFAGWSVAPLADIEEAHAKAKPLLDLARHLVGNDDARFKKLIAWFAKRVQCPRDKARTTPVFVSDQGAGKNLFLESVGAIFGQTFKVISCFEHLTSRFNEDMADAMLTLLDEAVFARSGEQKDLLKSFVTQEQKRIEVKGGSIDQVVNYNNLVIATNNRDLAAPVEDRDRRYMVFNAAAPRESSFYAAVLRSIKHGQAIEALFAVLLDFDFAAYEPDKILRDSAHAEQWINALTPLKRFWHECLNDGVIPGCSKPWPDSVTLDHLEAQVAAYEAARGVRRSSKAEISRMLSNFMRPHFNKIRLSGPIRPWAYRIPPLNQARAAFAAAAGYGVEDLFEIEIDLEEIFDLAAQELVTA